MPESALFHRDDGTRDVAGEGSPWDAWVSASKTRNFLACDPILDWLGAHGAAKGFTRDDSAPGYDPRTDFGRIVLAKGLEFERAVVRYVGERHRRVAVSTERDAARSADAVRRTFQEMTRGTEVLSQAPVWNPQTRTYGVIDLLVRSDVLAALFPGLLTAAEASVPAPDLPGARWHYRVVDVKFSTLDLRQDGHAGADHPEYAVQVWLYNEAIGRLQGFTPPSAYLLGRGWKSAAGRGASAMDRLSRVDRGFATRAGETLESMARTSCDWIRRMRAAGDGWEALPRPSVPELWPNMHHGEDHPWHGAKRRIAEALGDLTLLPRVSPRVRTQAHGGGLERWTDADCTSARLGIATPAWSSMLDAVLLANRSPKDGPVVFPARLTVNESEWRKPAAAEFFVDFETTNDVDDDFTKFPLRGGRPMIFMVGCGHFDPGGTWRFHVFTADRLDEPHEARLLSAWIEHLRAQSAAAGRRLEEARLFHWSPAEKSTLETAYNSAAVRHGLPAWSGLPWVDLWQRVAKAQPIGVRGAFGYGLKAIAKAMHAHGLVGTEWPDGVADGLGAMAGAWWCEGEAGRTGGSMRDLDLMRSIEGYNRVDVEAMRDVLGWLRANR